MVSHCDRHSCVVCRTSAINEIEQYLKSDKAAGFLQSGCFCFIRCVKSMKVSWYQLSALRVGFGMVDILDVNSTSLTSFLADVPNQITGRKVLIAGRGTNIVGRDESSDGDLVIRCSDSTMSLSGNGVLTAGTGCGLPVLAEFSARSGLAGLTLLGGIPGSLGGALRMNAGANGLEIGQFVQRIHGVNCRDLTIWEWNRGDGGWGYRQSPVPADVFLVSAQFELPLANAEEEIEKYISSVSSQENKNSSPDFSTRKYSTEEMNALFDSLDDIEI